MINVGGIYCRFKDIKVIMLGITFAIIILTTLVLKQSIVEGYMIWRLKKTNIVVSLTTTPYRINKMSAVIDSLTGQNAPIKAIYLSVPYEFKRDNLSYDIPNWLVNNQRVTILRTRDYGPSTKLLGLLSTTKLDPDTIIVTVDDDIIYPKNAILHLAYQAFQHPGDAVGLSGADLYNSIELVAKHDAGLGLKRRSNYTGLVTILQGYAGIAYHASFFHDDIYEIETFPASCINSDDLTFAFYLQSHNIPRRSIANKYIDTSKINSETTLATSADALQKLTPLPPDKHAACLNYLEGKYNAYPKI